MNCLFTSRAFMITGANSGIGKSTAQSLAEKGELQLVTPYQVYSVGSYKKETVIRLHHTKYYTLPG